MDKQFRLFLGCFVALVATAFGFIVRATIINEWGEQFQLSGEQIGNIQGGAPINASGANTSAKRVVRSRK